MNKLFHVQDRFQNYLLEDNVDFQNLIISTEKVSAEIRLGIYRNAYQSRLIEALASNYPMLNVYLGEDCFEKIASDYIKQFPSRYRSIRWFGDSFAHALENHPDFKEFPFLSELAQFEWTQTLVFDAADHPTVELNDVAQIPPESWASMQLRPHPSLHRISLSWNVVQIWQALCDDQTPPEPVQNSNKITWILWRQNLINQFCSLTESEAWAIDALFQNLTFGEICEGLCQWINDEEAGSQAASLLKGWILSGFIAEVNI